ncbi:hypothetical protein [Streptomyces sp. H51]|uniref:hypothetical protein n=1 Tax=Streptomyces sp. H51 TaxID=3111770 RepID=UPI003B632818
MRGLKVLARSASSKLDPTEAALRSAESARCRKLSDEVPRRPLRHRAVTPVPGRYLSAVGYRSPVLSPTSGFLW